MHSGRQCLPRRHRSPDGGPGLLNGPFAAFAILAVLLATLGLYAVMSHAVSQRVPEMALGIAPGASSRDVTANVAFSDDSVMNRALAVLEDGGEMVVVSVLCWYTIRLVLLAQPRPAR